MAESTFEVCTKYCLQLVHFHECLQPLAVKMLIVAYGWIVAYVYDCLYYDIGDLL